MLEIRQKILIVILGVILATHLCQGKSVSQSHKHKKSISSPGLLFGNPEVLGSATLDQIDQTDKSDNDQSSHMPVSHVQSKSPLLELSLADYIQSQLKTESSKQTDEAFMRQVILKRLARSPKKDTKKENEEEEDDEDKSDGDGSEEDEDEEEKPKVKVPTAPENSTGSSTSSVPSPTPISTTATPLAKPQTGTTTTKAPQTQLQAPNSSQPVGPPGPGQSVAPQVAPRNQNGTGPPPQGPPTNRTGPQGPPKFPPGMVQGKLPPGIVLPPGAIFAGAGTKPPGQGQGRPGQPGKLPPGIPPHLLFGKNFANANRNATPKAKKGELYLPEDYNNLEIPKLDAGKLFGIKLDKLSPVPVLVFLNIRSVRDIDETNEELVLDMDMKVEWVDGILFDPINALSHKPMKPITLNPVFLKKIWQPDIYIDELVKVQKTKLVAKPHTLLFSSGTGLVSYTFRIAVHLACEMNFRYYPSDTHRCQFHLRSYSYFDSDLDLGWLRNGVFLQDPGDPNFDLQVDSIEKLKINQVFHENNNDTYDGLAFTVLARRKLSFHMVQTYLPSVFFIIITWLCFLVPARMVEARIGISMTTLLTLTAMFSSVRESTPIVSYVKAIDIWMVFCIFFVFLTLLEFSLLVWIRSFREDAEQKKLEHELEMQQRRGSRKKNRDPSPSPSKVSIRSEDLKRYELLAESIEKWAFLIFSVVFLIFNIIYWTWLLNSSDHFNWAVNLTHNAILDEDD